MVFRFGEYELDEGMFELRLRAERVRVEPKVLELLFLLVRARPRLVTKKEIFDAVWPGVTVGEASLGRAVMEARRAIDDQSQELIVTVRGKGFRFGGAVTAIEETRAAATATSMAPPPQPRSSLVGREAYVAALVARFEEAESGKGSLIWLSGDAGIGKTRLADELAQVARSRGARVLAARCLEDADAPQLWPWLLIARASPLSAEVEAALTAASGTRFERFERFFQTLAKGSSTLVIVIDDVQWADNLSLELLLFVARQAQAARVLVIAAHRDVPPRTEEHGRIVGKLVSDSATLYLPLRPLSRDDAVLFTEQTMGRVPRPDVATTLIERSGGNPLYLAQLLKTDWAMRALGGAPNEAGSSIDLKPELLASIGRHVEGISSACKELLTTSAFVGREFTVGALAAASGMKDDEALALIDEGLRARILKKGKVGSYRFTHPLVRDVLYKGLSEPERVTRHLAVGRALLEHYGEAKDAHAAELAQHFVRAASGGGAELAAELSTRAAENAEAAGGHAEAARHYEQAALALALVPHAERRRVPALRAFAQAAQRAGDAARAREALLDAAVLARACRMTDALHEIEAALAQTTA